MTSPDRPLEGIKVVELSHMVLGPSCGLILADLGADVVKVEPAPGGDKTRQLPGSGSGYFGAFNRNKRSVAVDLKSAEGHKFAIKLVSKSDILIENFGTGVLDRLGLGYDAMKKINPGLVYCALKGFLTGPYENRAALDEVVQMMGGLAYMTGPEGRPLRAGTSVNDMLGALFGVVAIQAALWERERTGKGTFVRSGLFETNMFLVAQHMVQYRQTGVPAVPMPERESAWAVYDVFETAGGDKIFIGVVSDKQWTLFCEGFGLDDLLQDEKLKTNAQRVARREEFMPYLREMFAMQNLSQAAKICENLGLPFAPIMRPDQLFDDPHLNHPGATVEVTLSNGVKAQVPTLPIEYNQTRLSLYRDLPEVGEHNETVARELGYSDEEMKRLRPSLDSSVVAETD
ncbi:CoA transferase [Rhodobacteraceae bacterium]|jgi:crotonobetainyl-CoA:carnitine CoA-transferase CaiB-like acyl-CoA transferase|nr:CoA transferase [Paracoccaceae bacterium]|tara:strand:+ start:579 stop:1781 length:1203 start_codon:yes stop_codon:yes gene_type:complete